MLKSCARKKKKKKKELAHLESKTTENLWQDDLEELEEEYDKFVERSAGEEGTKTKTKTKPEDGSSTTKVISKVKSKAKAKP